jgi:hypothetical protein
MKEPIYYRHLINKNSCCLDHFSSNISCMRPRWLSLLWLDVGESYYQAPARYTTRNFSLLSTPSYRHSWDCNVWQSEWGFALRMITTNCVPLLNESWEGNETALCIAKQQTYEISKITGRLRNYYSWGSHVHNRVKWPERESDHKQLSDVGIRSGDIILCLYVSVRSI